MPHENTERNGTTVGPRCGRCYGDGEVPCECGGAWGCPAGAMAPCPACTKPEASACPKDPPCEWFLANGLGARPCSTCTPRAEKQARDCEHGSLARSCVVCELTAEAATARTAERERIAGLMEAEAEEADLAKRDALLAFAAKLRAEGT